MLLIFLIFVLIVVDDPLDRDSLVSDCAVLGNGVELAGKCIICLIFI